ncbi:DUF1579 family protein [Parasphingopyxis sp.]|uniref:DUF1579 family protein n=1 Tax=Parasphingopyxis sp. TaxID=1920299 RepID=UPI00262420CA|nr:DUF1579 family protein [Parasphingopyxis sp.]
MFAAPASGQSAAEEPNAALDFLIGEWDVDRVYRPGSAEERRVAGQLSCARAIYDAFVRCVYDLDRPDRGPAQEVVYFNHNAIYGTYENIWLSSSWPIKVIMAGSLNSEERSMASEAQFMIEEGRTESVRSSHRWTDDSIAYRVDIRTSEDPEGEWTYHMEEVARRVSTDQ